MKKLNSKTCPGLRTAALMMLHNVVIQDLHAANQPAGKGSLSYRPRPLAFQAVVHSEREERVPPIIMWWTPKNRTINRKRNKSKARKKHRSRRPGHCCRHHAAPSLFLVGRRKTCFPLRSSSRAQPEESFFWLGILERIGTATPSIAHSCHRTGGVRPPFHLSHQRN